jgi:hypothetical protein
MHCCFGIQRFYSKSLQSFGNDIGERQLLVHAYGAHVFVNIFARLFCKPFYLLNMI